MIPLSQQAAAWVPNPLAHMAAEHTRSWIESFSVVTPRAERYATLSAWVYPEAPLDKLELAFDVSVFFRVFDDFTDYVGVTVPQVHRVCDELTGVRHGERPVTNVGRMFADLWARQCAGAPDFWTARAGQHWEWYFSTQATYVALREERSRCTTAEYLEMRHGNGAVPVCLDLGEVANETIVPPRVYHSTQLRLMRRLASNSIVYCNDIYSSVRDRQNNDPRNLVAFTQRQTGCSWEEAVGETERGMLELDTALAERARRLDQEWDLLGFEEDDRALGDAYARIINHWHVGYQAWAADNELLMDTDPPRRSTTELLISS